MKKYFLVIFLFAGILIAQKPYVLLVSFDGFRWDYLDRGITPNLNQLADNGVRALSLRPTFPSKTFPNHYAIITGMYNDHHGLIFNYFKNPYNGKIYRMGDEDAVRNPVWYRGEAFWETARRQGMKTASMFWPGSELTDSSRRPNYFKMYEHNKPYLERVDTVVNWLQMPYSQRPHFITLYFDAADTYGHRFGPNSEELNNAVANLDSVVGNLVSELNKIGMSDSLNMIFVADHGMTEISTEKVVNISEILKNYEVEIAGDGPVMMITPAENQLNEVYDLLKSKEKNYKVYKKENLPEYYHYKDDAFIPPIILSAKLGWSLISERTLKSRMYGKSKGNHGYEKDELDMNGIFIANGPAFKNGFRTGTVWNIDIYPLLSKILGIVPNHAIDGKPERIEYILK